MLTETLSPNFKLNKTEDDRQSLTLVVCSNRVKNVIRHWRSYIYSVQSTGGLLIILDVEADTVVEAIEKELKLYGVMVIINGQNLGLAASRNIAIENCHTSYLVFIDDDVTISKEAISHIWRELNKGAEIVGVRVSGPQTELTMPWYISEGQLHYLAIHNLVSRTLSTWGACMGLNMAFVKATRAKFREDLGRKGCGLLCGEDTTFIRELKAAGARETFISEVFVNHNIDIARLSLTYMLRRAYWQGRSESRRKDSINGLMKEWNRFLNTDVQFPKKALLAFLYISCVLLGILRESLFSLQRKLFKRAI